MCRYSLGEYLQEAEQTLVYEGTTKIRLKDMAESRTSVVTLGTSRPQC
jgi:hypothetical protein